MTQDEDNDSRNNSISASQVAAFWNTWKKVEHERKILHSDILNRIIHLRGHHLTRNSLIRLGAPDRIINDSAKKTVLCQKNCNLHTLTSELDALSDQYRNLNKQLKHMRLDLSGSVQNALDHGVTFPEMVNEITQNKKNHDIKDASIAAQLRRLGNNEKNIRSRKDTQLRDQYIKHLVELGVKKTVIRELLDIKPSALSHILKRTVVKDTISCLTKDECWENLSISLDMLPEKRRCRKTPGLQQSIKLIDHKD